jgi:hypothetical protein
MNTENKPLSVELEGERQMDPICEVECTSDGADMSGASDGDEDPRNQSKMI